MDRILMRDLFWQLITDTEYQALKVLIETEIGIKLALNRRDFIENLLLKRFQALDIPDFRTYYELIINSPQELTFLINSLTNISTHFFREAHHFEYMANTILPRLASKSKIRLWSAGCSTGEEPYSMAITLVESLKNMHEYDIKILATDINTEALKIARAGIYNQASLDELNHYKKHFNVLENNHLKRIRIKKNIRALITFRKLNLLEPWPMKNLFDVIFCRNVTIYLKPSVIVELFEKFDKLLAVGGFLILGHAENLTLFPDRYICLGKTIYQKVG
jgi:chemotaxis protein methyltransferase CheR